LGKRIKLSLDNHCAAGKNMSDEQPTLDEIIERRDVLLGLKEAIAIRLAYISGEKELEVEALSNRALHPQCKFDRKHRLMIYALAIAPDQVSWTFKLREGIHRLLHHH
jgi:hypothetical protein